MHAPVPAPSYPHPLQRSRKTKIISRISTLVYRRGHYTNRLIVDQLSLELCHIVREPQDLPRELMRSICLFLFYVLKHLSHIFYPTDREELKIVGLARPAASHELEMAFEKDRKNNTPNIIARAIESSAI